MKINNKYNINISTKFSDPVLSTPEKLNLRTHLTHLVPSSAPTYLLTHKITK